MHAMAPPRLEFAGALGHDIADKRLQILRRVGETGSISQAARDAGVSYKAAWQALDTLSNLAGAALVVRAVGGAGGGGAQLTAAGTQLLHAAAEVTRTRQQTLARLAGRAPAVASLGLRTSMRNQFPATVAAVDIHGPLALVHLCLAGVLPLVARITGESAELLGLTTGLPVIVLCKATAVHVAGSPEAAAAGNLLPGRVRRVARGGSGDEVVVELPPTGLQMVGFASPASGLRSRGKAWASIDPAAVVIALPG